MWGFTEGTARSAGPMPNCPKTRVWVHEVHIWTESLKDYDASEMHNDALPARSSSVKVVQLGRGFRIGVGMGGCGGFLGLYKSFSGEW